MDHGSRQDATNPLTQPTPPQQAGHGHGAIRKQQGHWVQEAGDRSSAIMGREVGICEDGNMQLSVWLPSGVTVTHTRLAFATNQAQCD